MHAPRGKRVALLAGTVTVIASAVVVLASWERLREEWYIWRLSSKDDEVRFHAADVLATMKSVRAVPVMIRLEDNGVDDGSTSIWMSRCSGGDMDGQVGLHPLAYAILQIGPAALPALRAETRDRSFWWLAPLIELIESPPERRPRVWRMWTPLSPPTRGSLPGVDLQKGWSELSPLLR